MATGSMYICSLVFKSFTDHEMDPLIKDGGLRLPTDFLSRDDAGQAVHTQFPP